MANPAVVHNGSGALGTNSASQTITSSTAGNALLLCVALSSTSSANLPAVSSITDNQSQTWSKITGSNPSGQKTAFEIWGFPNTAAGVTTITVTCNANTANTITFPLEVSGLGTTFTVDVSSPGHNSSSQNVTSGATATSTYEIDFVLGGAALGTATATIQDFNPESPASPAWTNHSIGTHAVTNANLSNQYGFVTETTQNAYTFGLTLSSAATSSASLVVAFKGATQTYHRTITDTLTTADTLAAAQVDSRAETETLTTADTDARLLMAFRGPSEALATGDALAAAQVDSRAMAETLATTPAVSTQSVLARTLTDVLTTADSVVAVKTHNVNVSLTEQLSTVDALMRSIFDSVHTHVAYNRAMGESLLGTDTITRQTPGLARSIEEDLLHTVGDMTYAGAVYGGAGYGRVDLLGVTGDTLTVSYGPHRAETETLTTADSDARLLTALRTITDTLTTADTAVRYYVGARALGEALTTGDSLVVHAQHRVSISDSLATLDTLARNYVGHRADLENLVTGDTVARGSQQERDVSDDLIHPLQLPLYAGAAYGGAGYGRTDTLGATGDFLTVSVARSRDLTEALTTADQAVRHWIGHRGLDETLPTVDEATRAWIGSRSMTDRLVTSDAVVIRHPTDVVFSAREAVKPWRVAPAGAPWATQAARSPWLITPHS